MATKKPFEDGTDSFDLVEAAAAADQTGNPDLAKKLYDEADARYVDSEAPYWETRAPGALGILPGTDSAVVEIIKKAR